MKILICGLPGSGKTTLAKPFAELLGGIWLNADNLIFKNPDVVDYRVSAWFDDTDKELVKVVSNYIEKSK